ncbi:MAG: hypothetical protein ACI9FN_000804 [Saprospiraceae bacterium]|jgi:hypothetical protein
MKRYQRILLILTLILFFFVSSELAAQCPMCKIAAESNLENGGSAGKGLNTGILYMLTMPYLIIGILGFVWYRNRKSVTQLTEEALLAE